MATTDRGVRVLLQSEHGFHFSELNEFLDQASIYAVLERCIRPQKADEVDALLSESQSASFVMAWMLKYQLLELSDDKTKRASVTRKMPLLRRLSLSGVNKDYELNYPEHRRAHMLQPIVNHVMAYVDGLLDVNNKRRDALLQATGNELVSRLDTALLQAIGWFANKIGTTNYANVLEVLEQAGGIQYLMGEFPLWYRSHRAQVFHFLRSLKQLFRRVENDIDLINDAYKEIWKQEAGGLSNVTFLSTHQRYSVVLLTFDQG